MCANKRCSNFMPVIAVPRTLNYLIIMKEEHIAVYVIWPCRASGQCCSDFPSEFPCNSTVPSHFIPYDIGLSDYGENGNLL